MNLLGKILTVLIFVMSIAFLMIAVTVFASHRNWREVAGKFKSENDNLKKSNTALQAEVQQSKDRLNMEVIARRFALASLESKATQSTTQLEVTAKQLQDNQQVLGQLTTQNETLEKSLTASLDQNKKLRTDLRDAQQNRDRAFDGFIQATDMLHQVQGAKATLEEYQQQLLASNARMSLVLKRYDLDEFASIEGKPPTVEGIVTAVGNKDLLEISIGDDDGLKKGHTLEIYRSNAYLGRVIVRETWPDRAVVQVIPAFRKGVIKKGDRVATKFG